MFPAARQVHERSNLKYVCSDCGKSLSSKTTLALHQRTHTGLRPFECPDCQAKFTQNSALKMHRRYGDHHEEGGGARGAESTCLCLPCVKGFTLGKSLLRATTAKPGLRRNTCWPITSDPTQVGEDPPLLWCCVQAKRTQGRPLFNPVR